MHTARAFLFSREFRQLCLYGALLLAVVIALVVIRIHSTLRPAPPPEEKEAHSRRKRDGKWRIKGR